MSLVTSPSKHRMRRPFHIIILWIANQRHSFSFAVAFIRGGVPAKEEEEGTTIGGATKMNNSSKRW
jgi:hypothetical protein